MTDDEILAPKPLPKPTKKMTRQERNELSEANAELIKQGLAALKARRGKIQQNATIDSDLEDDAPAPTPAPIPTPVQEKEKEKEQAPEPVKVKKPTEKKLKEPVAAKELEPLQFVSKKEFEQFKRAIQKSKTESKPVEGVAPRPPTPIELRPKPQQTLSGSDLLNRIFFNT